MPDLTPDSEMMRAQQDKDTRQNISEDETRETPQAHDADPASGRAREAAKAGEAQFEGKRLDAVFQDNEPNEGQTGVASLESAWKLAGDTAASEKRQTGLAQPGRSRLGD